VGLETMPDTPIAMSPWPLLLASYPGLLAPVFVACSTTAGDKCWGGETWAWGYLTTAPFN